MKKFTFCLPVLLLVLLCACFHPISFRLPENPIAFENEVYVNPEDSSDTHLALRYYGRIYIPYGNLAGHIDGRDVGSCLGYYVRDGIKMEDILIYTLADDPEENFLMSFVTDGIMEQPNFFRAVDTKGKDIYIPDFTTPREDSPFWE